MGGVRRRGMQTIIIPPCLCCFSFAYFCLLFQYVCVAFSDSRYRSVYDVEIANRLLNTDRMYTARYNNSSHCHIIGMYTHPPTRHAVTNTHHPPTYPAPCVSSTSSTLPTPSPSAFSLCGNMRLLPRSTLRQLDSALARAYQPHLLLQHHVERDVPEHLVVEARLAPQEGLQHAAELHPLYDLHTGCVCVGGGGEEVEGVPEACMRSVPVCITFAMKQAFTFALRSK